MAERSLFDVRYAFPGYTFIFFTILLSFGQIIARVDVANLRNYTSLFGFIFLLSGAPLGYLTSQAWYFMFYHLRQGYYYEDDWRRKKRSYVKYIEDQLDFEINNSIDIENFNILLDYLMRKSCEIDKFRSYFARRWDLYHVMGATEWSIFFGVCFGYLLKVYCGGDVYVSLFNENAWSACKFNWLKYVNLRDVLIAMFGLAWVRIFSWSKKRIVYERDTMITYLLKNENPEKIKEIFSEIQKPIFQASKVKNNISMKFSYLFYYLSIHPVMFKVINKVLNKPPIGFTSYLIYYLLCIITGFEALNLVYNTSNYRLYIIYFILSIVSFVTPILYSCLT